MYKLTLIGLTLLFATSLSHAKTPDRTWDYHSIVPPDWKLLPEDPHRTSNASSRLRATLGYHSMPSLLVASPSGLTWRVSDNGKTKGLLTNAKDKVGLLHPVITETASFIAKPCSLAAVWCGINLPLNIPQWTSAPSISS
jgi:hypothetical protein